MGGASRRPAVHVQFYLTLVGMYVPDQAERAQAFATVDNILSIARKARFCFKWIDSVYQLRELRTAAERQHESRSALKQKAYVPHRPSVVWRARWP